MQTIRWTVHRMRGIFGLLALIATCFLPACTTIPRQELGLYVSQFNSASQTAEDLILSTKNAAQELADDPQHPASVSERTRKLKERQEALDARLQALRIIAQYNAALTSLAEGQDPAVVRASLKNLSAALSNFGIDKLSKLVADAAPYGELIATAVDLIDKYIKHERFRKAIEAGEKPVLGLLKILADDAEDIFQINEQRLLLPADVHRKAVLLLGVRFSSASRQPFADAAARSQLQTIVTRHNQLRQSLRSASVAPPALALPATNPSAAAAAADSTDLVRLESLAALTDQLEAHVRENNKLIEQIQAERTLIDEYKNLLASTQTALMQVRRGLDGDRPGAVLGFIADVYKLRQAYLAVRESR